MALVTLRRSQSIQARKKTDETERLNENDDDAGSRVSKSLNECYFANKGAALVLGGSERGCAGQRLSPARAPPPCDIQHHLQAMFDLLRPEETLKMVYIFTYYLAIYPAEAKILQAVKLESVHPGRTRYLVVVCRNEESALLGIDCNQSTTVGLVLRVLADTSIKLDGDGGFSVRVCSRQHIFKPVSVQAMWSALQTLHRASGRARELNHFAGGTSHAWCDYYESRVDSDRSCLNEWHAMDSIESRRPPSPDSVRLKPRERSETERIIRCTLKEIMMSVDLDEVTSKAIRGRLEDELDMDLGEYKSFIDQEMLTILGQMDAPTEVFEHVYLGSEWNASNLEELQRNGVRHILNVTREIDNFFPGMFDYLNIRVYDDEKTDLLKHWDNTYKYINKARNEGSKVLVHCKMGISRSASVVIAYAMKAYNWNFDKALKHVKAKRSCIKPNINFLSQLETYQGILDAMKNKEKLQRSKSETNLKPPKSAGKGGVKAADTLPLWRDGRRRGGAPRPRSWSPGARLQAPPLPTSVSLENLAAETRHMLMPCASGSYSVSPNQIMRLKEEGAPSVKHIVNEIESIASSDRRDSNKRYQKLNFGNAPETASNRSSDASIASTVQSLDASKPGQTPASPSQTSQTTQQPSSNVENTKIHTWDPGEDPWRAEGATNLTDSDNIVNSDSGVIDAKRTTDSAISGSEAREERRQSSCSSVDSGVVATELSRHSSWGAGDVRRDELPSIREHARAPLSDNERKFNETCAILQELASSAARLVTRGASTWSGRLSASAPADTWLRGGLRRRRHQAASQGDLPAGLVSHRKKEFEARSEPPAPRRASPRARLEEDLSVRVLVDRYDAPAARPDTKPRDCVPKKSRLAEGRALRHSVCGSPAPARPPAAPALVPTVLALAPLDYNPVLVNTVMSKAQNKKQLQHGKTHPLTRLNLSRSNNRCSNPVYNTM